MSSSSERGKAYRARQQRLKAYQEAEQAKKGPAAKLYPTDDPTKPTADRIRNLIVGYYLHGKGSTRGPIPANLRPGLAGDETYRKFLREWCAVTSGEISHLFPKASQEDWQTAMLGFIEHVLCIVDRDYLATEIAGYDFGPEHSELFAQYPPFRPVPLYEWRDWELPKKPESK
jgi:hypothetical protein